MVRLGAGSLGVLFVAVTACGGEGSGGGGAIDGGGVGGKAKGGSGGVTGGVGSRNGMVVTKTGLLFQLSKDGYARAYDVDTGKVLWKGKTAGQSIGIPTMYEHNGRQYVVFMSPPAGPGAVGGAEAGEGRHKQQTDPSEAK